jgi:hypothetical protein
MAVSGAEARSFSLLPDFDFAILFSASELLGALAEEDEPMTRKKTPKEIKSVTVVANDPDNLKGTLKNTGGSQSDHWNNILADQTVQALWLRVGFEIQAPLAACRT